MIEIAATQNCMFYYLLFWMHPREGYFHWMAVYEFDPFSPFTSLLFIFGQLVLFPFVVPIVPLASPVCLGRHEWSFCWMTITINTTTTILTSLICILLLCGNYVVHTPNILNTTFQGSLWNSKWRSKHSVRNDDGDCDTHRRGRMMWKKKVMRSAWMTSTYAVSTKWYCHLSGTYGAITGICSLSLSLFCWASCQNKHFLISQHLSNRFFLYEILKLHLFQGFDSKADNADSWDNKRSDYWFRISAD